MENEVLKIYEEYKNGVLNLLDGYNDNSAANEIEEKINSSLADNLDLQNKIKSAQKEIDDISKKYDEDKKYREEMIEKLKYEQGLNTYNNDTIAKHNGRLEKAQEEKEEKISELNKKIEEYNKQAEEIQKQKQDFEQELAEAKKNKKIVLESGRDVTRDEYFKIKKNELYTKFRQNLISKSKTIDEKIETNNKEIEELNQKLNEYEYKFKSGEFFRNAPKDDKEKSEYMTKLAQDRDNLQTKLDSLKTNNSELIKAKDLCNRYLGGREPIEFQETSLETLAEFHKAGSERYDDKKGENAPSDKDSKLKDIDNVFADGTVTATVINPVELSPIEPVTNNVETSPEPVEDITTDATEKEPTVEETKDTSISEPVIPIVDEQNVDNLAVEEPVSELVEEPVAEPVAEPVSTDVSPIIPTPIEDKINESLDEEVEELENLEILRMPNRININGKKIEGIDFKKAKLSELFDQIKKDPDSEYNKEEIFRESINILESIYRIQQLKGISIIDTKLIRAVYEKDNKDFSQFIKGYVNQIVLARTPRSIVGHFLINKGIKENFMNLTRSIERFKDGEFSDDYKFDLSYDLNNKAIVDYDNEKIGRKTGLLSKIVWNANKFGFKVYGFEKYGLFDRFAIMFNNTFGPVMRTPVSKGLYAPKSAVDLNSDKDFTMVDLNEDENKDQNQFRESLVVREEDNKSNNQNNEVQPEERKEQPSQDLDIGDEELSEDIKNVLDIDEAKIIDDDDEKEI